MSKKDLSDFPKAYDPKYVEKDWDGWWDSQGYFKPSRDSKKGDYTIIIPPPNVTGSLHMGHALQLSIEDAICRYKRMKGYNVLWIPGVDHAGIATQSVVEKKLMKENISKYDLGREEFLKKVWEWKGQYGDRICLQFRNLGISVDWDRFFFTMDDTRSAAVNEAFVRMYEKNVIFRANRLVNWSVKLQTAISDLEVEHIDIDKKTKLNVPGYERMVEFGVLHKFNYYLEDGSDKLTVATTRLETMFGDTAVAVHPEDERYKKFHGKYLIHPFNKRKLKVILDSELVDMSFGTGAVKITPAHDPNDFVCGKKHDLEFINVFTGDGLINHHGGELFEGVKRFDARYKLVEELTKLNAYEGEENNPMRLGLCSRSGDVIEPMMKPQWWVDNKDMARRSVEAVRNKELVLKPEFHDKTWYQWLENIKDWCISRQLWWGHRIPAYLVKIEGVIDHPESSNQDHWIIGRTYEEALEKAKNKFNVDADKITLTQDPDVLDTWFSSGLLPFSALHWPNTEHADFKQFFPTQLLETGHDILFFWVARMVMMSLELTDKLPFNIVYLHAIIRDHYGRKMSKSLGNVIDPMWMIKGFELDSMKQTLTQGNLAKKEIDKASKGMEKDYPKGIPECGADAMRYGLLAYTLQGRFINLDVKRVYGWRMFCNKIWNASKYALQNLTDDFKPLSVEELAKAKDSEMRLYDQWILGKLYFTVSSINTSYETYQFADICQTYYNLFLYNFCDIYLEMTKSILQSEDERQKLITRSVLYYMLDEQLRLLHPMMPFITEELYQRLPNKQYESIVIAEYPNPELWAKFEDSSVNNKMDALNNVIKAIRSIKSNLDFKNTRPDAKILSNEFPQGYEKEIEHLAKLNSVEITTEDHPKMIKGRVDNNTSVFVSVTDGIDLNLEIKKLNKMKDAGKKYIDGVEKRINKKGYSENVPEDVRQQDAEKISTKQEELKNIEEILNRLEGMIKD